MDWTLVVASNDDIVLSNTLLRSECLTGTSPLIVKRGFPTAGAAYNSGLDESASDLVVFAHQDVFLPPGWINHVKNAVRYLNSHDPTWAVLGVYGIDCEGHRRGFTYSTGLGTFLGGNLHRPARVQSLDEMLLILRRSTGLRFDPHLPGYHLYGTDICASAKAAGFGSYVIDAFCIHNSNGLAYLPEPFWVAYAYMKRKWRDQLPIKTPCVTIEPGFRELIRARVVARFRSFLGGSRVGSRVSDPAHLFQELLSTANRATQRGNT